MKINNIAILIFLSSAFSACKKETDPRIPPDVRFKSGTPYLSGDTSVHKLDSLIVGVKATKTEDDLKTFNVSVSYDGRTDTETKFNEVLAVGQRESYEKDFWIHARDTSGSEEWIFSVVDRDGNITQKKILLTVQ